MASEFVLGIEIVCHPPALLELLVTILNFTKTCRPFRGKCARINLPKIWSEFLKFGIKLDVFLLEVITR